MSAMTSMSCPSASSHNLLACNTHTHATRANTQHAHERDGSTSDRGDTRAAVRLRVPYHVHTYPRSRSPHHHACGRMPFSAATLARMASHGTGTAVVSCMHASHATLGTCSQTCMHAWAKQIDPNMHHPHVRASCHAPPKKFSEMS